MTEQVRRFRTLILRLEMPRWHPELFFGRLRLWSINRDVVSEAEEARRLAASAEAELAESRVTMRRMRDRLTRGRS